MYMEQNEENESFPPQIDESEYKMPESSFGVTTSKSIFPWPVIFVVIFLLVLLTGLGFYIYMGMSHTPATISDTNLEPVSENLSETNKSDSEDISPEMIAKMQSMQRDTMVTDEDVARMESMQQEAPDQEIDQEVLDRMQAMNPDVSLPNP